VADKSFLLYEHFRKIRRGAVGAGVGSYNIVVFLSKFNHLKITKPLSNYLDLSLLTAFLITFIGILLIAIFVYTPQRIKADFIREYPQFVKA
jgi:DNA integrity scanning protein DisA with diadenylate cyclase activity